MTIIAPGTPQQLRRAVPPAAPARRRASAAAGDGAGDLGRIGIVFVHGIGAQRPGETLLDWSRPLIKLLSEWRIAQGLPPDPVIAGDIDFSGATLPTIELDIPPGPPDPDGTAGGSPQRWLLTEAWWAARVQPPSLGSMISWLRADFGRVVDGIRRGYWARVEATRRRRALLRLTDVHPQLAAAGLDSPRWRWIDRLDRLQARSLALALGVAWIVGLVLLLPYSAFRAIPIKALRDAAVLRQLDSFLVDWFGDMRILLHDPAQAANIRGRLLDAMAELRRRGCGPVIVIAHSGGAVVSFTTLTDPTQPRLPVTKLVTLGQGLDLAWRLENAWNGLPPGDRLIPMIPSAGLPFRWVDYWATFDPAPGGPLDPPSIVLVKPDEVDVRNRMSILQDHGTYWENDEEFLIPLLQQLDTPDGPPSRSRFFPDRASQLLRVEWRKQRVGVLAAWRWVCLVFAFLALGGAWIHAAVAHGDRLRQMGEAVTRAWGSVPGSAIISGPIDWLANLTRWPDGLPTLGEWVIGCLVVVLAFVALARFGVGRWERWDARERWLIRSEPPRRPQRRGPAVEATLLVGAAALLALVVALS